MSRDFQLLRLTARAATLNDLDESCVETADWAAEAVQRLQQAFPDFCWEQTAEGFCGEAPAAQPRCRIHLFRHAGYTTALVSTSLHADQGGFVRQLAGLLEACAFDLQTGQLLG